MRKHWQTNYCLQINYCLHAFGLTNYTFLTKNLKRPNIYFQYAICKCSTRLELKKFNFKNAKFTKKQHSESQKHSEIFGENCIQKNICSCYIFAPFDFIISGWILDWANINSTVSNYLSVFGRIQGGAELFGNVELKGENYTRQNLPCKQ